MHVLINFIDFIFQMKISVQMQLTQTHSRVMQFAGVSLILAGPALLLAQAVIFYN